MDAARLTLALVAMAALLGLALLTWIAVRVEGMARRKADFPLPRRATLKSAAGLMRTRLDSPTVSPRREPLALDEEEMFNPTLKGPHR